MQFREILAIGKISMHHIKATFDKLLHYLNEVLRDNPSLLKKKLRPGPKYRFTDIDVVALSLTSDCLGLNSENYLFAALNSNYKDDFPHLLSRRQFNDRRKALRKDIEAVWKAISQKMDKNRKTQDIYVIDSMPLRLCRKSRSNWSTICKDDRKLKPKVGWNSVHEEWFYGFKLNIICTGEGVIKSFKIDESTKHDIHYLDELDDGFRGCRIVGDKGYISKGRKEYLFDEFKIQLETPPKANQKNQKPFAYSRVRKRIETLFSQLDKQFKIQENYAKTFNGYLTRIHSKICALTLIQYINKCNERPISLLQYALCA
jgi:hypothetical protein